MKRLKIGVLGAGAIGGALIEKLCATGFMVFYKDPGDFENSYAAAHYKQTIKEVLQEANVILGCTGINVLDGECSIDDVAGKWFISCGSMDTEFLFLLKYKDKDGKSIAFRQRSHNPFSNIVIKTKSEPAYVVNGGFPVNFDRKMDSVPLSKIQLTRAMMHTGLLQARGLCDKKTGEGTTSLEFYSTGVSIMSEEKETLDKILESSLEKTK